MITSKELLKFRDEEAYLAPEGVEAIKALPGLICPIIFIGDGRGGKSYLASRLLGLEGAFVSSDSAEPVTEGIDMVTVPVEVLLQACPDELKATCPPQKGECVLILDCEGGNNAMAAIRTLVNVFGIILGTVVVFVANGMATEQALQNLGASLAARTLVRLDNSSKLPQQRLIFVVNKNSLTYEDSALEDMLNTQYDDSGRQELRDTVKAAFPERDFFTVPIMGLPLFEESVQALRSKIIESRRPLVIGGTNVHGAQLCGLLDLIVSELRDAKEVSFPSMKRYIIYEGYLVPLVGKTVEGARSSMPKLEDYCEDLAKLDPRAAALADFSKATAHLVHESGLIEEARTSLEKRLDALWRDVEHMNETFGMQVARIEQEEREVLTSSRQGPIGGRGLLKNVIVTTRDMTVERRAAVHRKRGGTPECSEWVSTQCSVVRLEESAFEQLPQLPVVKGHLQKQSPSTMRSVLKLINKDKQARTCVVKDGHFIWWEPDAMRDMGEARGCLNFLVHQAEVVADPNKPNVFMIRPKTKGGWMHANVSFTGGEHRAFVFDTDNGEVSRDQWVQAIQRHIDFGELARQQLGLGTVLRQVDVYRPTLRDVEP